MSDIGSYEAAVMAAMCGASWSVDVNGGHWFIVCTQSPGHHGPHVGSISWPKSDTQ